MNRTRFPATNPKAAEQIKRSSMNVVSFGDQGVSVWYPQGNRMLYVANGPSLHVTHHGSSSFHVNGRDLFLHDIVVVPISKKNLFLVNKFCADNFVVMSFDA